MSFPKFRNVMTLSLGAALLAACSSSDEPAQDEAAQIASPQPALTPNPVATAAPDGTPLEQGVWSIEETASGASAAFGQPQSDALMVVACDAESRMLTMSINSNTDGSQPYIIEAGGTAARLDMMLTGGELPMMRAEIALSAPVFGGFVLPGQIFTITSPDGTVMRLPSAPGIRRIFEACA